MVGVYEFELFDDEGFVCAFPFDLGGGTRGEDWRDAAEGDLSDVRSVSRA